MPALPRQNAANHPKPLPNTRSISPRLFRSRAIPSVTKAAMGRVKNRKRRAKRLGSIQESGTYMLTIHFQN